MRLNDLYNEKIDNQTYDLEVRCDLHLFVNDYEIAKDWIDESYLIQIKLLMKEALEDSIITNKNPYFFHKNPEALNYIKIKNLISQMSYADISKEKLLSRAMAKTSLDKDKCIEIIYKYRPDITF